MTKAQVALAKEIHTAMLAGLELALTEINNTASRVERTALQAQALSEISFAAIRDAVVSGVQLENGVQ